MIILASKSPRRIEIFNRLDIEFKSIPAEIDENIKVEIPGFAACRLAEMKAEAVGVEYPGELVVGVDTVVFYNSTVIGKPADFKEAVKILSDLSGEWHSVISGVCILCISTCTKYIFSDVSRVKFRDLTLETIKFYLKNINPYDKAGGYAIQEKGDILVEKIVGSEENIVGFPTEKFLYIMDYIKKDYSLN